MFTDPNSVRAVIKNLIRRRKNIPVSSLAQTTNFLTLGFDELDVVDLILEVEKIYELTIPDDVPLYCVEDFVVFINAQIYRPVG